MSVILGVLREADGTVSENEIRHLLLPTKRYADKDGVIYVRNRLGMGLQLSSTHERSALDDRPLADSHRNVICFDGRLDNYEELIAALRLDRTCSSDSKIVLAAFRRWGAQCFSRLWGDWALALWCERERTLFLARDHAGTRTLYLSRRDGIVLWSTHLDTFLQSGMELKLGQEYVANYLSGTLIRDLTPYEGIRSIRPAHFLALQDNASLECAHWNPSAVITIHYKQDAEYEEHFLDLFLRAVERRTGTGAPILAELSGGIDSTSIVCASDFLRRKMNPESELLETISYCDDDEVSLDERPYFTITETARGRTGTHLEMSFADRTFSPHDGSEGLYATPGSDSLSIARERRFEDVWKRGFCSILSGVGGDELLGGVPDPYPELSGYLISAQLGKLLTQGVAWSLVDRAPLIETLTHTLRYTTDIYRRSYFTDARPSWLTPNLQQLVERPMRRSSDTSPRWKHTPRQLENERTWGAVMETLPHLFPRLLSRPEYRYPYLDKDLVNYLHAVPSEQLLRPGRRRSLMRRALVGIVPKEILERKRKAFQLSGPMRALQQHEKALETLFAQSISADCGFIDADRFRNALCRVCSGDASEWQGIVRVIALELWLQSVSKVLKRPSTTSDEYLAA